MKVRRTLLALALVSSLVGVAATGLEAATVTKPVAGAAATAAASGTTIDWAIDASVARSQMAPAEQRILREQLQMQFQSLDRAQQAKVLAAAKAVTSDEGVLDVIAALADAVKESARAMESELRVTKPSSAQGIAPKLGGDGDYVFVATAGPCRVYDSRFAGPGQLAAASARQVYVMSSVLGYSWSADQGGTGSAGSGNCVGTVFNTPYPVAAVATVTVVNTTATGALQAWNGGTTLSGGAVVNWNPGDRLSNTTVIPMNRSIAAYPNSGAFKRDIAVNNNSGAAIDFVIDVVGYFIESQATALDCTSVSGPGYSLASGDSVLYSAPACPAGYTRILGLPVTNAYGVDAGTILEGNCRISNYTGAAKSVNCNAQCCRVPGR